MTPSQVKKALQRNKRAGRRPWSQYQLADMRGCDRSLVARVLQNPRKSRPLWEWIVGVLSGEVTEVTATSSAARLASLIADPELRRAEDDARQAAAFGAARRK